MAGIVNGIDTNAVGKTVHKLRHNPELGKFEFRARNRWLGDTRNLTRLESFYGAGQEQTSKARPFILRADEPYVLAGNDTAPNPVEHLLNALAGCVTTAIVLSAAVRGIHIEEVESELSGHLDVRGLLGITDEVRKGYEHINLTLRIRGDGTAEQLEQLAEYSPVYDVVRHGTKVNLTVKKIEATERPGAQPPEQHPIM